MSMPYRVICSRRTLATRHVLSEWHTDLASALPALFEHCWRPWQSVALVPQVAQVPQVPHQEQRGFAFNGETR